ncbi:MAG: DNA-binding response regulator [Desulfuromonas sp.]|nr:MAG: DNA-binding response regulator [Desulfuromonas sp.]
MKQHILLVEDEMSIAQGLLFNLEAEGYQVTHAQTGEEALEALAREHFQLVLLDIMLPGISGFEVCRQLRERDNQLPVLMLTARETEEDRVRGLGLGADDYLAKPFSLDELMLRIEGMLRRSGWYRPDFVEQSGYVFGNNHIDFTNQRAETEHGEIALTDLETRMLRAFFDNEGIVLSRKKLLSSVWGVSPQTETRTLDNFVVRLRRYFEHDPSHPEHFLTVRGRGYRFVQHPEKDRE